MGEEKKRDRARQKPRQISGTYFWGKHVGFARDEAGGKEYGHEEQPFPASFSKNKLQGSEREDLGV